MRIFDNLKCIGALAALSLVGSVSIWASAARAGGFTPCEEPFIFPDTAANFTPIEYLATATDRETADFARLRSIQDTAQHLAWLVKLDSWHQPTYGSLGVVAHMFLGGSCDPDVVLQRLLFRSYTGEPMRSGQILVLLQGTMFKEGEQILVQSRIRAFRRNDVPRHDTADVTEYFEHEGLSTKLRGSSNALIATLPPLDITFAARALTVQEFAQIDTIFKSASALHSEPLAESPGTPLPFEPDQPHPYSVRILEDGKWLKLTEFFTGQSGFIRVDPEASRFLHEKLPELDFLNGLLGFLRIQQDAGSGGLPASAPTQASESLSRFLANKETAEDTDARALAAALTGIIGAGSDKDWKEARSQFAQAVKISPYRSEYRNMLGLADAHLCCASSPTNGFEDPAPSFADSLSLDPNNLEALKNLAQFLASLGTMEAENAIPAGINATRLQERRKVIQTVLSSMQ